MVSRSTLVDINNKNNQKTGFDINSNKQYQTSFQRYSNNYYNFNGITTVYNNKNNHQLDLNK